jgi:manganese transport protein
MRRLLAITGPALLVSVGYMDPGNWATDLEGGARFGYQLLWVLVLSNIIALLLQMLSARLGIVTGLSLAQSCRSHYAPGFSFPLWLLAEVAIVACDMAELLGSAVALNMLFGIPLITGALLTALDVLLLLALQRSGMRALEACVLSLLLVIALCMGFEMIVANPPIGELASGLIPRIDGASLYIAIGMLGATVMPHNLYLHSALVPHAPAGHATKAQRKRLLRSSAKTTWLALNIALLINAAILIVAAAVFAGRAAPVTDLRDAHQLLTPLTGASLASVLFAIALLCAGQSATLTGTLAGQVVMEGFMQLKISPFARRALTRGVAIVPAVVALGLSGEGATTSLLVASQVVLSLQLPFAVIPLIRFTSSQRIMGEHVIGATMRRAAQACALLVIGANIVLVVDVIGSWSERAPLAAAIFAAFALLGLVFLAVIAWAPLHHATPASTREERAPVHPPQPLGGQRVNP